MTKVGAPRQQKDRGQGCLEKSCEEKRSYDKGKYNTMIPYMCEYIKNKGIKVVFNCISSNFKTCGNLRELYYKYRQDIKVLIVTGMYRISGYRLYV